MDLINDNSCGWTNQLPERSNIKSLDQDIYCDYLIVGLQFDPSIDRENKNSPVQTIVERYTQLKAVSYVDEIVPYSSEKDLEDILSMYNIDVRILGEEYRDKDFTGKDICRKRDIKLYFNKRDHRFSSSDLRERVCNGNS